jgi:hypothetical protein
MSAELVSATQCAQEMLFSMRVLESMNLKVKKPMVLEVDNKGAVDLSHNWSISGRSRHDSVRQSFLRELNEEGVIELYWILTEDNSADLFTKNLSGLIFEKHAAVYCGIDEYMDVTIVKADDSQGEGVRGQVEVQVEHGDVANDLIYYKGHKVIRGNIVENHQSHGRTPKMQSGDLGSHDGARQGKVIVDKAHKVREVNPILKDSHSIVTDKVKKAVRFGTIKVYD